MLNLSKSSPSSSTTAADSAFSSPASTSPCDSSRASLVDAPVLVRRTTRTAVYPVPSSSKSKRTRASTDSWLITGATDFWS